MVKISNDIIIKKENKYIIQYVLAVKAIIN